MTKLQDALTLLRENAGRYGIDDAESMAVDLIYKAREPTSLDDIAEVRRVAKEFRQVSSARIILASVKDWLLSHEHRPMSCKEAQEFIASAQSAISIVQKSGEESDARKLADARDAVRLVALRAVLYAPDIVTAHAIAAQALGV